MRVVDRLEFPKRYKPKQYILLIVILLVILGIFIQRTGVRKNASRIQISDIRISNFGNQFIELEYTLANTGKREQEIALMAKVWDSEGEEIASALFSVKVKANSKAKRSKMLDKLNRSLKEGERPYKAEISLYTRHIP
ncbi:MAG TPA: hypothetical protein PLJ85_04480 [Candidatus Cloacimonas sp.]|nr:MAG: hypothetical protein BWX76_00975 [Candidatus Cloacimonetes bacterium ADurb.Bin089]HQO18413.1 hypothetical protein [Candidatus Cloacimonas sp.]